MPLIATHELDASAGNIYIYNGMDCLMTYGIRDSLNGQIPQIGPLYNFELALQGPVLEMMTRGFRVDPVARERGIYDLRQRLTKLSAYIDTLAAAVWDFKPPVSKNVKYPKPTLLNPDSTDQLIKFFYGTLGIPPITKYVKGEPKTPMDRDTLEKLEAYFLARPFVAAILAYRDAAGQLEVLESEVDSDWRMRTVYQIAATDTTRFSSTKSITGSGRNMQNIEEGLRHIFIADEGYKIYGIDLEQAESREVGLLCGLLFDDWTYLDLCESTDLHTAICKMVWPELNWRDEPKHDRAIADTLFYRDQSYRQMTKRLGHGSNYLGQPRTMSMHTKIPFPIVSDFQYKYFFNLPAIPRWHQWVASELQTKQRLTNVFGCTRDFFGRPNDDDTLRAAVAHGPQSATAQRLNLGMWKLWRHYHEIQLLAQLHDAVYFQAPEHLPEHEVARTAISLVEVHQKFRGRHFVIPCDIKCGKNWGPWDAKKNPNGLRKIILAA